jgi:hypothetical protein
MVSLTNLGNVARNKDYYEHLSDKEDVSEGTIISTDKGTMISSRTENNEQGARQRRPYHLRCLMYSLM